MYVSRVDVIENGADSQWAKPFIIEKIFSNLLVDDRKILKCKLGNTEDIQILCKKADELISSSERVVGAFDQGNRGRGWQHRLPIKDYDTHRSQFRQNYNPRYRGQNKWHGKWHDQGYQRGWSGPNWHENHWQEEEMEGYQHYDSQKFGPGGGKRTNTSPFQHLVDKNPIDMESTFTRVFGDDKNENPLNHLARNVHDCNWDGDINLPQYINHEYDEYAEVPTMGYILGCLNTNKLPIAIDTGASKSLMNLETWESINSNGKYTLEPQYRGFMAINGSSIKCLGSVIIQLMLMGETMNYIGYFKFYIVEGLSIDALLGVDEIFRHRLRINTSDGFARQDNFGELISNLVCNAHDYL